MNIPRTKLHAVVATSSASSLFYIENLFALLVRVNFPDLSLRARSTYFFFFLHSFSTMETRGRLADVRASRKLGEKRANSVNL